MKNLFDKKMTLDVYLEHFSETGVPVFERAAELSRERVQNHIAEAHIIVALFQIVPDWVAFRISQKGVEPKSILAFAEAEIQSIKPFNKGGIKIHPSASDFFSQAIKLARADGRSQIDCVDLISALSERIEDLIRGQNKAEPLVIPLLIKSFRQMKKLVGKSRNK